MWPPDMRGRKHPCGKAMSAWAAENLHHERECSRCKVADGHTCMEPTPDVPDQQGCARCSAEGSS